MLKLLVFLLAFCLCNADFQRSDIISASVYYTSENIPIYVAYVRIGSPVRQLMLQVSWSESDVILFGEYLVYSNEFEYSQLHYSAQKFNGQLHDILFVGNSYYYVPVTVDGSKRYSEDEHHAYCLKCNGIIGFGTSSVFWRLWNGQITFSRDFIQLGDPYFLKNMKASSGKIKCNEDINNICAFGIYASNMNRELTGLLSSDLYNIYVPDHIYSSFVEGRNIYNHPIENWNKLTFHVPVMNEGEEESAEQKVSKIEFKPSSLIISQHGNKKKLLLNNIANQAHYDTTVNNGDHVIFGVGQLQEHTIHFNKLDGYITLYSFDTAHHYSAINMILFTIQFVLFIRWKLTDPVLRINSFYENTYANNAFTVGLELLSIMISIMAYVMDSTQDALSQFTLVNVVISLEMVLFSIFEIMSIIYLTMLCKKPVGQKNRYPRRDIASFFHVNLIRHVSHDSIQLITLWLLLLQRTQVTLAIVPTVLINMYMFYDLSFYIHEVFSIPISEKVAGLKRSSIFYFNELMICFSYVILPIFFYFQLGITYYYFIKTWIDENATYLSDISAQIAIIILATEFVGASLMLKKYIEKYNRDLIKRWKAEHKVQPKRDA